MIIAVRVSIITFALNLCAITQRENLNAKIVALLQIELLIPILIGLQFWCFLTLLKFVFVIQFQYIWLLVF